MKLVATILFAHILLFTSCKETSTDSRLFPVQEEAFVKAPGTTFELLKPEYTGIQFVPNINDEFRYNFMSDPYIYNGGGVAVLDVNNDGLQDIFFTARLQGCQLYLNQGTLQFEDISMSAGISKYEGLKTGATVVDINGDGWQDIYVSRTWLEPAPFRRNLLFINNQDNTFSEKAAEYNLDDLSASQHANFFDYDLDGDLDCYILNHPTDFKTMNTLDAVGGNARAQAPRNEWDSDRLMENQGGHFEDVTQKAGLRNRAFGLSSIAADFNGDGWMDLFVGNDFVMPDFLYINNRNGTFTDQGDRYFRHTSNHTMGADLADINNDGYSDLITLDMLARPLARRQRLMNTMQITRDEQMREKGYGRQVMRNALQLNTGNQGFSEIACLAGVSATDWSWAPLLADFDNDGLCDIFISNGIQRDLNDLDFFVFTADSINRTGGVSKSRFPDFNDYVNMMPSVPVHNYAFHNMGNLQFEDVSTAWGFENQGFSNGAAYADLDNDGDLDLITNNLQAAPSIYKNKATEQSTQHWLQLKCAGTVQNPFGIGAKVRVYGKTNKEESDARLIFSEQMTNVRGFYSSVEPIFQVGLAQLDKIERIEIDWGENKHQILSDIGVNQRITLNISAASPGKCPQEQPTQTALFIPSKQSLGIDFTHRENSFEDFDREKLLPYRLSRTGPSLASADLNGDGLEDLFIAGAAGQAGVIYLQNHQGVFNRRSQAALESDKDCEDTASTFFDADGDGDMDLLVISGGNEAPVGSMLYQDRLYLNDGRGNFVRAQDALPIASNSGSCVQVYDFDKDGLLDVFVGGRSVPGRFPEAAESMVLKNEGGVFKNVTPTIAPDFQKIGMVTDLQLGDLNKDGRASLIVCGDWMPLHIFQWTGQRFDLQTTAFSQENNSGLWRCLTVADIDGDGDLDIAAGNMGLNTRFHATEKVPMRLFASDFDHNGSLDPILALAEAGMYKPVVQLNALAAQIPSIKKKFSRNSPYAEASMADLYSSNELFSGLALEAHTLESQWFRNDHGKFTTQAFPAFAQISTLEKILIADFTNDGLPDILTLGNDFGMDIDTYQLDAADIFLFRGIGNGQFAPIPIRINSPLEARDAILLNLKGSKVALIVANSNSPVLVFELPVFRHSMF